MIGRSGERIGLPLTMTTCSDDDDDDDYRLPSLDQLAWGAFCPRPLFRASNYLMQSCSRDLTPACMCIVCIY